MSYAKTKAAGAEWAKKARESGWSVSGGGGVLTISRTFTPGDRAAYVDADMDACSIMSGVPVVGPGSTWGSTSDGIGGCVAIDRGVYTLKRSGVSKNFTNGAAAR